MGGESHTGRRRPSQDKPRLFRRQPTFWSAQANFLQRWKQIGLTIKETFQKAISLCQFKRTSVNRHGEFTAQDIVGGTNGWSSTTTKAEEKEWRGVIHHTLNKASVTDCPWPKKQNKTKQRKKNFFLIGEAVVFSFFFHLKPTPSIVFFSHPSNFLMLSLPLPSPPPPPLSALLSFSVSLFPSLPLPPPCFFIKTIHCALLRPPSWNGKTNIAADRWNEGGRGQRKRAGGEERGG